MTTSTVTVACAVPLYITAALPTAAPTSADAVAGVDSCSVKESSSTVTQQYLGDGGWDQTVVTRHSFDISLSGHTFDGDAPQGVLRTAKANGTRFYVTIVTDPGGSSGAIGKAYPVKVTDYSEDRKGTDLVAFSSTLKGDGAPVAI